MKITFSASKKFLTKVRLYYVSMRLKQATLEYYSRSSNAQKFYVKIYAQPYRNRMILDLQNSVNSYNEGFNCDSSASTPPLRNGVI